jgi:hypothetical protein
MESYSSPIDYIDQVPKLLSNANVGVAESIVGQLKIFAESDSSLLLPIVAALSNAALPEKCYLTSLELCQNALATCSEGDFPFIVRSILKGLSLDPKYERSDRGSTEISPSNLILVIRKEVKKRVSDECIHLSLIKRYRLC